MQFNTTLNEKDIAMAVSEYLQRKGYNLMEYRFNTRWSYDRVLFDVKVKSWFTGMDVTVTSSQDSKITTT